MLGTMACRPKHLPPASLTRIPLSLQDKIVISKDEVITNNGDTKVLPYKTRKSFWVWH